ncbi:hypothetical protein DICVIV_06913 [Dictyocaulus viviparus]|uniref:Uncharacterized protein n=1 Tax=Dictyocaulus viviparus TaxID=29172 RepID=A0A0D8XXE5_DICVI|nr:hypothetical protein DICVIV_06913 [Dictyocaulus viviparus]
MRRQNPRRDETEQQIQDNEEKNKNEGRRNWHTTLKRIKTLSTIVRKQRERRKQLKKTLQKMIANSPEKFQDPLKIYAVQQMQMEDEKLLMKKKLTSQKRDEIRVPMKLLRDSIKMQMEDEKLLMKKKLTSQKRDEIRVPMKLLRDSIKLVLAASGKNVTKFDKKTVKLASPRLLSVVPEQDDEDLLNILSPSLFSLHEDGTEEEKSMSLPNLLKELPNSDQEAWLDFITEAAGVSDTVDKAEKEYKKLAEKDMMSFDEEPLYLKKENVSDLLGSTERRKIETFEMLDRSYTIDQKIHRRHENPHHLIERDIRALAEAKKFRVRQKDITLSPFVLTPLTFAGQALSQTITLSPLLLSPITLSPAVLGPIILSPWVFVPLVLSPRVLSPLVLSPLVFSPIILSPLVLHPLILVPGIFNPLILSPLVLSPLILSPQLFSPLILSPMVLNPLILTPIAGSPLVLSPFLLSPIIGSPLLLSSVVLSPYALSPLIESKLVTSEVILSPSWLS